MELHALDIKLAMAHAHDLAVFGFRGHFQAARQAIAPNRKRVIPGRKERARDTAENTGPRMDDPGGLPVNHLARMPDCPPEGLADRLMPQAHSEYRHLAREIANCGQRYSRFARGAGSRGNDDALRAHRPDVRGSDLVVAGDLDLGSQFLQILHEVPGERIVVVDHEDHGASHVSRPFATISAARNTALALACVSRHSFSGTESATIPAPAWTCMRPALIKAVRIAMARSMSPLKPRYPTAPAYRPRLSGSSSSIISIARTFGAPLTVPAGNAARRTSTLSSPSRSLPSTLDTMCITCE